MYKMMVALLFLSGLSATAQKFKSDDVRLEIEPDPTGRALVNWSITNNSKLGMYVYDFFLWGPGEWNEQDEHLTVLGTAPSRETGGCAPNRVAPVLLLVVAPGRTIRGDFIDSELKLASKSYVSMRIAIFSDPYRVVEDTKRFVRDACKHNPYDAIVRDGTIVTSKPVQVP